MLSPLPAGGSRHGTGGALANFPASRLVDLSACWFFSVVAGAGGSLPHWVVAGQHTGVGGERSRHGAGAGALANFPTFQLSNFPASRLVGLLVCWRWWGLRVPGYSEALMRISERGCIRAAE